MSAPKDLDRDLSDLIRPTWQEFEQNRRGSSFDINDRLYVVL